MPTARWREVNSIDLLRMMNLRDTARSRRDVGRCSFRTYGATRVTPPTSTCGSTKAGLDQPRLTAALLAKLASEADGSAPITRPRPRIRALQGSRDQARDARRGMRAGLAPDRDTAVREQPSRCRITPTAAALVSAPLRCLQLPDLRLAPQHPSDRSGLRCAALALVRDTQSREQRWRLPLCSRDAHFGHRAVEHRGDRAVHCRGRSRAVGVI